MRKDLRVWGGVATAIYLASMLVIVGAKWQEFTCLDLNELGDFLAGAFGPIAFLWLVLGFLQQGRELKVSSDALVLQADELKKSVEQQTELVRVTREQHELQIRTLDDEARQRLAALEPKIEIETTYPSSHKVTGSVHYGFKLTNFGANCHKLTVFAVLSNVESPLQQVPFLKTNASIEFNMSFDSRADVRPVLFQVVYENDMRQERLAIFDAKPDAHFSGFDGPYFTVSRKTPR